MDTMQALDRLEQTIGSNEEARRGWQGEIDWCRGRRREWGADRIRIGVIGVTSSGKSTLINAILGREILSSAVAPSSGQLVYCSSGKTPGITVYFEDGSTKRLEGSDYTLERLQEYSDERFNRDNTKGVLSIELTSPQFDLGSDVILVDSPGLDAYGLEVHERITLESLVPTMDMCIYITTTKTNSDEKMRQMLDVVAKYHCPIVIVQNMIDAVRPSAFGDKSSAEVAEDHLRRVRRIVDASEIEDKKAVEIVQMSSKNAVYERVPGADAQAAPSDAPRVPSNYGGFVSAVHRVLDRQRPRIDRQRLLSVQNRALDVAEQAESQIDGRRSAGHVVRSFPLAALERRTNEQDESVRQTFHSMIGEFETRSNAIVRDLGTGKVKKDVLRKNLARVNNLVQSTAEGLLGVVSDHNAFIENAAHDLRRPSRDLQCPISLRSFSGLSEVQKTETKMRRVKKEGFFKGKAARFFGKIIGNRDMGYEKEKYQEVVTDKTATRKAILDRLDEAGRHFRQTSENWLNQRFDPSMSQIREGIQDAKGSYEQRLNAVMRTQSLMQLHDDMRRLAAEIDAETAKSAPAAKKVQEQAPSFGTDKNVPRQEVAVSDLTSAVLRLARGAVQKQHLATHTALHEALGTAESLPVIISWDRGSLQEFVWQTGLDDAKTIEFPNGPVTLPDGAGRGRTVFVLVNTPQYGAARKQIEALRLNDALRPDDFVVWVVQDFQELINTDRAVEGLEHMLDLRSAAPKGRSLVYLSHSNPVYNLGFLKYQLSDSYRHAPATLMNELQNTYGIYTTSAAEAELGEMFRRLQHHFG